MNMAVAVDLYNLVVLSNGVCQTLRLISSDADHVPVVIERRGSEHGDADNGIGGETRCA